MVTIVTRAGKGSPLTSAELDANLDNLKVAAELLTSSVAKGLLAVEGTATFTVSTGGTQTISLQAGAATLSFTGWAASGQLSTLLIAATNPGLATLTFPAVQWCKPDGTYTAVASTYLASLGRTLPSSGVCWFQFWTVDGGATVYGKLL